MGLLDFRRPPATAVDRPETESSQIGDRIFDTIFTAAISAIIAIYFAWRVLFFGDKRPPSIQDCESRASTNDKTDDDSSSSERQSVMSDPDESSASSSSKPGKAGGLKSLSTLLDTDTIVAGPSNDAPEPQEAQSSHRKAPPVPPLEKQFSTGSQNPMTPPEESPPIEINTYGVQRALEEEDARRRLEALEGEWVEDDGTAIGGMGAEDAPEMSDFLVFGGPGLIQFVTAAGGSLDPGFGYLDAITEEDSDDLRSQTSSVSSSYASTAFRPHSQAQAEIDERISTIIESQQSTESSPSPPPPIAPEREEQEDIATPMVSRRQTVGEPELLSEADESLPSSPPPVPPSQRRPLNMPYSFGLKITDVAKQMSQPEKEKPSESLPAETTPSTPPASERDRDQSEEVIVLPRAEEVPPSTPPPPASILVANEPVDLVSPHPASSSSDSSSTSSTSSDSDAETEIERRTVVQPEVSEVDPAVVFVDAEDLPAISEASEGASESGLEVKLIDGVATLEEEKEEEPEVVHEEVIISGPLSPGLPGETDDGRISSTSVSIDFENSRDSILDQSLCSNPQDEAALVSEAVKPPMSGSFRPPPPSVPPPKRPGVGDVSADDDLPPPPPPAVPPPAIDDDASSDTTPVFVTTETSEIVLDGSDQKTTEPTPDSVFSVRPDKLPEVSLARSKEDEKDDEKELSRVKRGPTEDLSSPERLSSLLHGYTGGGLSPLYWQTRRTAPGEPLATGPTTTTTARAFTFGDPVRSNFSTAADTTGPLILREERNTVKKEVFAPPPVSSSLDVDLERSSRRLARYGATYADSPLSYAGPGGISQPSAMSTGVDAPPQSEAPPPPYLNGGSGAAAYTTTTTTNATQANTSSRAYAESIRTDADLSRDDLMSEGRSRSRATIREIPVQRSQSAFSYSRAPTTANGSMLEFKTPGAGGTGWTTTRYESSNGGVTGVPGEEYYRREVMTRTLVSRSYEALTQQIPRVSPLDVQRYAAPPTDDVITTDEYITTKYTRSVEEEERRIRESQERRRMEEEERRRREEEIRRRFEIEENERLERIRREKLRVEKELESSMINRERAERERIEQERIEREEVEKKRRFEWERIEAERRAREEQELARRREIERLERERLERERLEAERIERERIARERAEIERIERERAERERRERERLEIERLEIERIERIKREQIERERIQKQREAEEAERREKERLEAERLERERIERERIEREFIEQTRREAEERERERREDERREAQRREQEARDRALLEAAEQEAAENERKRRLAERAELERIEVIRREQERIERERIEAERRERERLEEERRERELFEAQERAKQRREQERIEEELRERERLQQEAAERERRERERREAIERERLRQIEEQRDRERIIELERLASDRQRQRQIEDQRARELESIAREAERVREAERLESEERERQRLKEERRLAEIREVERRNAELRDRERREAAEREAKRRRDDRRSREALDMIVRERETREQMEIERKRLLAERDAQDRRRKDLTSSETLQRLTRRPYYSRENLSQPDVTTKVERQVIERVDRTLYSSDGHPLTSTSYYTGNVVDDDPLGYNRDRLFQSRADRIRDISQTDAPYTRRSIDDLDNARAPATTTTKTTDYLSSYRPVGGLGDTSRTDYRDTQYPRVGPSPYEKKDQDVEVTSRSRSVLDYDRKEHNTTTTRRPYSPKLEQSHSRSKSADILMDQRTRESTLAPENELQKYTNASALAAEISDHELRFRKSVDKLNVPDWYRDFATRQQQTTTTTTSSSHQHQQQQSSYTAPPPRYDLPPSQPWSYTSGLRQQSQQQPVGGITFPPGMFDKYKDEIEDMRRSRTSLHQLGQPQEHTKVCVL